MQNTERSFSQDYYSIGNRQALDYIYSAHLGFSYGNCFKYTLRAGRKVGNSAESDLNKALNYITSSNEEFSFFKRIVMKICNSSSFSDSISLNDKELANILNSIIKFDKPEKIAKMIVTYANERGINVRQEYKHFAD